MELIFSGIDSSGKELMPGSSDAAVREQKDIIEDGRAADVFPSENIMLNMEKAAAEILAGHGITNNNIEISVTFVDENEIRQLNRMYRDIDKVTDVLSFPQFYGPEDIPEKGPAVEAGERLGFLPGDLQEKVDPYLRPLYDALYDVLGRESAMRLKEKEVI